MEYANNVSIYSHYSIYSNYSNYASIGSDNQVEYSQNVNSLSIQIESSRDLTRKASLFEYIRVIANIQIFQIFF